MGAAAPALSYCGDQLRRYDHDRFLVIAFAPADRQEALFALHAFNLEIAKTREVVTEELIGRMRLQWWRDSVAAAYGDASMVGRPHQVLEPLGAAIARFGLSRSCFDRLIDAREADLQPEGPATMACLVAYAETTAVPLVRLSLEVLGAADPPAVEAGRLIGIAYALTGLLRASASLLRRRRLALPADRLSTHGVHVSRLYDFLQPAPGLAAVAAEVAAIARNHLAQARALRRGVAAAARPALRLAVVAELYLNELARAGHDPLVPRLATPHPLRAPALAWSRLRGRY